MKVVQVCKYRNDTVEGVDLFEEVIRAAHGHDRSFYIFHGEAGNLGERLGCDTVSFNFSKSDIKRIRPSAVLKVLRQLRHDKPDVIITHRMKPSVFVAWCALFLPGTRKISVVHNMGEFKKPRRRLFARVLMRDWKFALLRVGVSWLVGAGTNFLAAPNSRPSMRVVVSERTVGRWVFTYISRSR